LQALSSAVTLATGTLLSFAFLPVYNALGATTFLFFAIPLTVAAVFIYYRMPETRPDKAMHSPVFVRPYTCFTCL
jgi:hypothetical protein